MRMAKKNRVVITGLGTISAIGESTPEFKTNLFRGECGIRPVTLFDTDGFPTRMAAEIKSKNLESSFNPRTIKRTSRCDILGLFAAREAMADADLDFNHLNREQVGVVLGGGAGGMRSWEKYRRMERRGGDPPRASWLLAFSAGTLTDLIGSRYGFNGTRATITTACSSSSTAIGYQT